MKAGRNVTCDGCSKDISEQYLTCDALDGEWCHKCFGKCPCPPGYPCNGEGCPTLITEDADARGN